MFVIEHRLSASARRDFVALLEQHVGPRLRRQRNGYAAGRRFAWLAWEPAFVEPALACERPRGRVWEALQSLTPGIETAECWFNGDGSSPGIRPHRDAPYAHREAYLLNLGPTTFRIWLPDRHAPDVPCRSRVVKVNRRFTEHEIELRGGELIAFDCKTLHASSTRASRRWGVGMWRFQPEWKARARFVGQ